MILYNIVYYNVYIYIYRERESAYVLNMCSGYAAARRGCRVAPVSSRPASDPVAPSDMVKTIYIYIYICIVCIYIYIHITTIIIMIMIMMIIIV